MRQRNYGKRVGTLCLLIHQCNNSLKAEQKGPHWAWGSVEIIYLLIKKIYMIVQLTLSDSYKDQPQYKNQETPHHPDDIIRPAARWLHVILG